ncbi:MAG: Glyoxalase/bleomycin resistance protein/dioxygenase [Gemmatimonadetes bacterium]|nr:Glyoxalase/bleomycin resistance protein/dioxygenase [Gemmatimonadota bacterium]
MTVRTMGRTTLLVRDYEKALVFYRDRLGFRVLHDERMPSGERYLHIGLGAHHDEPPVGLWLLEAKGADESLVGRQAGSHPFLVLYTDDCDATVRELERAKVEIRRAPFTSDGATFAHIADLYGNELVIVELERIAPSVTQAIRARVK